MFNYAKTLLRIKYIINTFIVIKELQDAIFFNNLINLLEENNINFEIS